MYLVWLVNVIYSKNAQPSGLARLTFNKLKLFFVVLMHQDLDKQGQPSLRWHSSCNNGKKSHLGKWNQPQYAGSLTAYGINPLI